MTLFKRCLALRRSNPSVRDLVDVYYVRNSVSLGFGERQLINSQLKVVIGLQAP